VAALGGAPDRSVDSATGGSHARSLAVAFASSIGSVDAADWDACVASDDPFLSHVFLKALEDSGAVAPATGWAPRHMTLRDGDGRLAAVAPVYLKSNSDGEYWSDHAWAHACQRAGGRYYPKLLVGVPLTPVSGRRLLIRPDAPAHSAPAMIAALEHAARRRALSSIHATFPDESDLQCFQGAGWLVRNDIQYEWTNAGYGSFGDFLGALTAPKRSNILRQRRAVADSGIRFRTLTGDQLRPEDWTDFVHLHDALCQRRDTPTPLTLTVFQHLGQALRGRLKITFADDGNRPIGAMLCVLGDSRIYLRNWGCLADHKFLHFETAYYREIEYAIEHGYRAIEGGYGGVHKLERGFLPKLTHSLHWFGHGGMTAAVDGFLQQERADVLRRFAGLTARSPFRRIA
jgi:predicted N-acyltransferase